MRLLGVLGYPARPLLKRIDRSRRLSHLIDAISSSMATQRGLPILIGISLLVLSWIGHGIVLAALVASDSFESNLYWLCIPLSLFHVGVLFGFVGVLIAIPLGQGYKDK